MEIPDETPRSADCARLLLDTIPPLMRMLGRTMRRHPCGGDEAPTFGQIRLLHALGRHPCSLGDLATHAHVASSTMSRTIDALVKRGWVARREAPHDRRQVLLELTDEGRAAHAAITAQSYALVTEIMERLTPDELLRVHAGLIALRRLSDAQPGCTTEPE